MRHVAAIVLAVGLVAGAAPAELCTKCKARAYTADVGKCVACGGHTGSGAFKLCSKCSTKLGQCEHCRAKLPRAPKPAPAKPKPAPTTRPAKIDPKKSGTYTSGKWWYELNVRDKPRVLRWGHLQYEGIDQLLSNSHIGNFMLTPWGRLYFVGTWRHAWGIQGWQPALAAGKRAGRRLHPKGKLAAQRVRSLKGASDNFWLSLSYYGPSDKAHPSLRLRTPERSPKPGPNVLDVHISRDQAAKIIDQLAADGLLARSDNTHARPRLRPTGPTYVLAISSDKTRFEEDMGWDLEMLSRLDDLRKVLDGDAGKAMDKLLARLAGHRKQWSKEAATKPAPTTRPAKDMAAFLATLPVPKVDPTKEGRYTYTRGRWTYELSVKPRLRWGHLFYNRVAQRPVRHNGGIGNFFDTPWGRMYYHGEWRHPWGVQGWQLVPPRTGSRKPARLRLREWEHVRKRFLTGLETLYLHLQYHGPQDKPYYSLTLRVPALLDKRPPFWPAVQIKKGQARKIVEHLGTEGFLVIAENVTSQKVRMPRGPTYTLTVVGTGGMKLYEDLGWDLNMLSRLDDLRKVLDGDAGKAMDKLLARMAGHRKQWSKAAATRPATRPAGRGK